MSAEPGGRGGGGPAGGPPAAPGSDTYKGWLFKWTNYLKGYQRRWFVLSNGLLSYYRTQAEMAHTCRGTINLSTAHIDTEDSCNIVLSNGGRTYHLKANSEVERQRWVTALELAKAKAIRMRNNQSASLPFQFETANRRCGESLRSGFNQLLSSSLSSFIRQATMSLHHQDTWLREQLYIRAGCIGEAHVFAGLSKPSLR
ncbi:oxysterol-binding protein 2 [Grus japonensis]|uniref:Oxysterol-binding protein 2 n=1 Tax=Grus japonensis TaxID=30415 RepID=A0ABC9XHC0_GRUJA